MTSSFPLENLRCLSSKTQVTIKASSSDLGHYKRLSKYPQVTINGWRKPGHVSIGDFKRGPFFHGNFFGLSQILFSFFRSAGARGRKNLLFDSSCFLRLYDFPPPSPPSFFALMRGLLRKTEREESEAAILPPEWEKRGEGRSREEVAKLTWQWPYLVGGREKEEGRGEWERHSSSQNPGQRIIWKYHSFLNRSCLKGSLFLVVKASNVYDSARNQNGK